MPQPAAAHESNLRCSVIVPVYNGAQTITRCLDALAAQRLSADDFEVIVVSDGATDDTAAINNAPTACHNPCETPSRRADFERRSAAAA